MTSEEYDKNTIELAGSTFKILKNEPIKNGDWYYVNKNGKIHLLVAKEVRESFIIPTCNTYWFDLCDCTKLKLIK